MSLTYDQIIFKLIVAKDIVGNIPKFIKKNPCSCHSKWGQELRQTTQFQDRVRCICCVDSTTASLEAKYTIKLFSEKFVSAEQKRANTSSGESILRRAAWVTVDNHPTETCSPWCELWWFLNKIIDITLWIALAPL